VGHVLVELISNPRLKNENAKLVRLVMETYIAKLNISKMALEVVQQHLGKHFSDQKQNIDLKTMLDKKISLPASEVIDSHIKHPREMNLEELECHLTELQSKGLNTRGVLRRLLQLTVREGRLERALEVKKRCDELKVDISPGMLACTFDLYVRTKKLERSNGCS